MGANSASWNASPGWEKANRLPPGRFESNRRRNRQPRAAQQGISPIGTRDLRVVAGEGAKCALAIGDSLRWGRRTVLVFFRLLRPFHLNGELRGELLGDPNARRDPGGGS